MAGFTDTIKQLWALAHKIEKILSLQIKMREALEKVDDRLRALEDRMTHMEADQGRLITEAKSAATAASTAMAGTVISEVVTRLTRVEMRVEEATKRLSPPSA